MVNAHDTVRVMECLVQYGNESEKLCVFEELKDEVVTLSQSIYARFLVRKLLEYG
jgi:pumilio family protein 6